MKLKRRNSIRKVNSPQVKDMQNSYGGGKEDSLIKLKNTSVRHQKSMKTKIPNDFIIVNKSNRKQRINKTAK